MLFKAAAILVLMGLNLVLASPGEAAAGTRHLSSEDSSLASSVECASSNLANVDSCRLLIQSLTDDGSTVVPDSPRDICVTLSGQQCCVSWSRVANGLQKSDLVNSATKVFNQCSNGQTVSGLERGVELHGTFGETQCLSNRPTGCPA